PGPADAFLLVGRVLPGPAEEPAGPVPLLPERLEGLRLRRCGQYTFDLLESVKPAGRRLAEQARLARGGRGPVLLGGEPGSGKAPLARITHPQGPARDRPSAALDCARLPASAVADVLLADNAGLGGVYLAEPARLPRDLQSRLGEWLAARDG